jgi:hypothetical protein
MSKTTDSTTEPTPRQLRAAALWNAKEAVKANTNGDRRTAKRLAEQAVDLWTRSGATWPI